MMHRLPSRDLSALPGLVPLVDEITQSHQPVAIQQDGETVALLIPAGTRQRPDRPLLIDTSDLPPLHYGSLDELIVDREPPSERAFTLDEIKTVLKRERGGLRTPAPWVSRSSILMSSSASSPATTR